MGDAHHQSDPVISVSRTFPRGESGRDQRQEEERENRYHASLLQTGEFRALTLGKMRFELVDRDAHKENEHEEVEQSGQFDRPRHFGLDANAKQKQAVFDDEKTNNVREK